MADVAACFAMRDMLETHPYFRGFEIVVAAGTQGGMGAAAKPPVEEAIGTRDQEHKSGLDHPVVRQADDRGDRSASGARSSCCAR